MISINNLTVAYGGFTLLNEINFHISESDKIGLVGKNGAGKSTILKLICGLQSPTSGKVAVPGGLKIGYLPQIMEHHRGRSVIDEAMTAFADMFAMEAELESITLELAERTDYESKEYQDLIIRNSLEGVGEGEVSFHLAHILCLSGHCNIRFNGSDFNVKYLLYNFFIAEYLSEGNILC